MSEACRHYWIPTEDDRWACTDCADTCAACIECRRWTGNALLICDGCTARTAALLGDIETAIALHSPAPRSLIPPVRYDRDRIRGSWNEDPMRWTFTDLAPTLTQWADMWAEESAMPRRIDAVEYLRGHILWAAHNPVLSDWAQWLAEMRRILHVAKREAGILPKRMPAPCVHCGGIAVQDWADASLAPFTDGLQDEVRCLRCRRTWNSAAHFGQVSKEHLHSMPERFPDTLVTLDEAALVWPEVPARTWQTWLQRGEIPAPVAWDVRGVAQYLVGDLAVLPARRLDRTRRGRRAG